MKYKLTSREEEIKKSVAYDFFNAFTTVHILGNIDFCVSQPDKEFEFSTEAETLRSLLWAEAKKGNNADINDSFVQLLLTIGKEKTNEKYMPPIYLGAFDAEKIAFIKYHKVLHIFLKTDFNWNVTPSNHDSNEFHILHELVEEILDNEKAIFLFDKDEAELKEFIKENLAAGKGSKIQVTKNNFIAVFNKWCAEVMPDIGVNWTEAQKTNIFCGDFFLADLINDETQTLYEKLDVVFHNEKYHFQHETDKLLDAEMSKTTQLKSKKNYKNFWNKYDRPPKKEHWEWFIERKDLLVPQDVRERKGSFFTPQKWVALSQQYIANVLGENWQDDYYVWDCCAGTGNLLKGLSNKRNIFASTLDKGDVGIMKELADKNVLPMFEENIFQFDFLNDDFQKDTVPERLRKILADENERKKLVIYINPPYAEATTKTTISGTGDNKAKVATENGTYKKYKNLLGKASNEVFTQFFIRIYQELSHCILAEFSKTKHIQSQNFETFRNVFLAKLERCFLVPGNTFDNVKGHFPIGFFIWNTGIKEKLDVVTAKTYDENGNFYCNKDIKTEDNQESINKWIKQFDLIDSSNVIGYMGTPSPDFQHCNQGYIAAQAGTEHFTYFEFNRTNLLQGCIYFSVRLCVDATWLNDRDQFLYPKDGWQKDSEFQTDCLTFTLFHGQNRISATHGINYWIPFTEDEVGCKKIFESSFMSDFIRGKLKEPAIDVLDIGTAPNTMCYDGSQKIIFSAEAQTVIDAGKELWRYYFTKPHACKETSNASFYDIRSFFQGKTNERMNKTSTDKTYNGLIANLRTAQKTLALKIEQKVYAYGFLK